MSLRTYVSFLYLSVFVFLAIFVALFFLKNKTDTPLVSEANSFFVGDTNSTRKFKEVLYLVENDFPREEGVSDEDFRKQLTNYALKGILEGVDPYSRYLAPEEQKEKKRSIEKTHVTYRVLASRVGYFKIPKLSPRTIREFTQAVQEARKMILQDNTFSGMIVDLRKSSGDVVPSSRFVDMFLKAGIIVIARKKETVSSSLSFATPYNEIVSSKMFLVVLVDEGTRNGAEVVAAALQDNKRAIVIGRPTQGSASEQTKFKLQDGSNAVLTTVRYKRPNGELIEGKGVIPDIIVPDINMEKIKDDPSAVKPLREENLVRSFKPITRAGDIEKKEKDTFETVSAVEDSVLHTAVNIINGRTIISRKR